MKFTLVSTVFNEISRIADTIADINNQTRRPDEVVITDAGSKDGTYEFLIKWSKNSPFSVKILQENGCNVARGRNLAIKAASHSLIVSTDFGCRFHSNWLESLVTPFETDPNLELVGGAFSVIETDITTKAAMADFILQKGYPVVMDKYFSVSSRSIAYFKSIWEKIGGYPEWLTLAADDTIYWMLVKKLGFNYILSEKPYVYWGRHKTNKAIAREAFRYGLGDGESRINYRNFWSNFIETGLRYLFFLSLIFLIYNIISLHRTIIIWNSVLLIIFAPGFRSYINAFKNWQKIKSRKYTLKIFILSLCQLELSRLQYIKGYLKGFTDPDPVKKQGREKLWKVLAKKNSIG